MPGPLAQYQAEIEQGGLIPDPAQRDVVVVMQSLFDALTTPRKKPWWPMRSSRRIRGIYVVGSVGRGKTHLMDLLAQSLNDHGVPVWRIHFHRFMAKVHEDLKTLVGKKNPLSLIADRIASDHRVLCFDECHVEDIGDAMILGELLQRLFERGVVLVTTSNQTPDELYTDGLQRVRFLPAIEAIKTHCQLIRLEAKEDYRLRTLRQAPTYFYPLDNDHLEKMAERFRALSGHDSTHTSLTIQGRSIEAIGAVGHVAWFDFHSLCQTERSARDYSDIFDEFQTVLISGVPIFGLDDDNATKRFIHLVDEAYDRRIKLVLSAADLPQRLYGGKRLTTAFERTASRLIEMQSSDYLAQGTR